MPVCVLVGVCLCVCLNALNSGPVPWSFEPERGLHSLSFSPQGCSHVGLTERKRERGGVASCQAAEFSCNEGCLSGSSVLVVGAAGSDVQ